MNSSRMLRKPLLLLLGGCVLSALLVTLGARAMSARNGSPGDQARAIGARLAYRPTPESPPHQVPWLRHLETGIVAEFSKVIGEVAPFDDERGAVAARAFLVSNAAAPRIAEGEQFLWMGGSRTAPKAALVGVETGEPVPVTVYESTAAPGALWALKDEVEGGLVQRRLWVRYCFRVSAADAGEVGYCVEIPVG